MELGLPYEALSEATVRIGEMHAPELEGFYPASSVMLAADVSVTTLKTDMNFKKALYASAGIPEYWVLDVDAARIHQFWSPQGEDYAQSRVIAVGERLESVTIAGLAVGSEGLG